MTQRFLSISVLALLALVCRADTSNDGDLGDIIDQASSKVAEKTEKQPAPAEVAASPGPTVIEVGDTMPSPLVFKDTPLTEVVSIIATRMACDVTIEGKAGLVTGDFAHIPLEKALMLASQSAGLRLVRHVGEKNRYHILAGDAYVSVPGDVIPEVNFKRAEVTGPSAHELALAEQKRKDEEALKLAEQRRELLLKRRELLDVEATERKSAFASPEQ